MIPRGSDDDSVFVLGDTVFQKRGEWRRAAPNPLAAQLLLGWGIQEEA